MASAEDPTPKSTAPATSALTSPAIAPAPTTNPQDPAVSLPPTASYPADWAAVQAYYGGTPPHFYSPHLWGSQHLMPPYGTPIQYPPMYHPVYAHPTVATAAGYPVEESGGKAKGPGKSGDGEKVTSGSADDYGSQSGGESGSEGSSDTKDNGGEPKEGVRKRSYGEAFTEGETLQPIPSAQNNGSTAEPSFSGRQRTVSKLPVSAPGRATIPGPTTNLNIGMDVWSANQKVRPSSANVGANGVATEHQWIQDERELKRERRKQSNRESARRSRLRKQQECEDLGKKVNELSSENSALKNELEELNKACKDLEAENASIMGELNRMAKTGLANEFEGINCNSSALAVAGEGGGHIPQNPMGSNGQGLQSQRQV